MKVCVFTGSRAEYGLLKWPIDELKRRPGVEVSVIAGGSHLSYRHGYSISEVEEDHYLNLRIVESQLSSDSGAGMAKSIALGISGVADALLDFDPDCIVILGDRFETFAAAVAATSLRISIVHLHGGELTEGAIDDAFRHAITKMAQVHFVATENSRRRVIQMGEDPESVHNIGAVGLDALAHTRWMSREEIEEDLEWNLHEQNIMAVFHPETLNFCDSKQVTPLLEALDFFTEVGILFSLPNADPGGWNIHQEIVDFASTKSNVRVVTNLGRNKFLSCLKLFQGIVGNSSSGLIEAPSLGAGSVDIGIRQRGRDRALSVITCPSEVMEIRKGVEVMLSPQFQEQLGAVKNPYGGPGASKRMANVMQALEVDRLSKKSFYDLEFSL